MKTLQELNAAEAVSNAKQCFHFAAITMDKEIDKAAKDPAVIAAQKVHDAAYEKDKENPRETPEQREAYKALCAARLNIPSYKAAQSAYKAAQADYTAAEAAEAAAKAAVAAAGPTGDVGAVREPPAEAAGAISELCLAAKNAAEGYNESVDVVSKTKGAALSAEVIVLLSKSAANFAAAAKDLAQAVSIFNGRNDK